MKRKVAAILWAIFICFAALSAKAAGPEQDYPVIYEKPPSNQTVTLVSLRNSGWNTNCKGRFDITGDYLISMSVPKGVRADQLRMMETLMGGQNVKDAITTPPMTFLGVGTPNARFCLGLRAAQKAGGADNFVKNIWVWVKR